MHLDQLRQSLESPESAVGLLAHWGIHDQASGWQNLTLLAQHVGAPSLLEMCQPLDRLLPRTPDPDMALNNLERFFASTEGVAQLPVLMEDRARTLEKLLQWLSTSQYFSDVLASHPDYIEILAVPLRGSPSRQDLRNLLQTQLNNAADDAAVLKAFRRFRQRHTLRIGTNDLIRNRPLEEITRDLSRTADVAIDAVLSVALRIVSSRYGTPFTVIGQPARCVVLAFGKLGGKELNYSSDIDLMFVYDEEGTTRGARSNSISNDEFFGRITSEVVRLLSAHTAQGQAYRVDLRLRPEGHRGPLARSLASTLSYYDTLGRTWERQALIKVRPVAGDAELGAAFIRSIEPFVYRTYLSFAEINEIKALKRRMESATGRTGGTETDVKTGHGGIRDIEYTIQFLQLLNGSDLPEVRHRNTLTAMQALEQVGCLTDQEYHILEDAYRYLRKTEHRLQLLFDLQTHRIPEDQTELRKLALRMGYSVRVDDLLPKGQKKAGQRPEILTEVVEPAPPIHDPLQAFLHDLRSKTDLDRKILNHLLHETFHGETAQAEPESDLVLDPAPDEDTIRRVLGKYRFQDPLAAYQNLTQLAQESVRFLSGRRCRHFLASIAPEVLRAIAETPDPDMALLNLEKVTASLGAKSVLWELFSFNPPSLKLYVDLCASSQFLADILVSNPGMIDELLDSLVLNQPRSAQELDTELSELCRGAADPEPILHSFQHKELLRIGVRDILGKDTLERTTAALSDLAETILIQIARLQENALRKCEGTPTLIDGGRSGQPSRYAWLGLGKLGGREMSYQSDLDLMLIYEGDGRAEPASLFSITDNFQYFTELARRVIRLAGHAGAMGRLYQVDMRLRPTGQSGSLVIPLDEFRKYYEDGCAQLWERQALTRARIIHGDAEFARRVMETVEHAAYGLDWRADYADEVWSMRGRMAESGSERDLKRGVGGIVDVEFVVQLLKLKYGAKLLSLRQTNTWRALDALRDASLLSSEEHEVLAKSFVFLRLVEARLRIVHNRSLAALPGSAHDLEILGRRLDIEPKDGFSSAQRLTAEIERHTSETRKVFRDVVERER